MFATGGRNSSLGRRSSRLFAFVAAATVITFGGVAVASACDRGGRSGRGDRGSACPKTSTSTASFASLQVHKVNKATPVAKTTTKTKSSSKTAGKTTTRALYHNSRPLHDTSMDSSMDDMPMASTTSSSSDDGVNGVIDDINAQIPTAAVAASKTGDGAATASVQTLVSNLNTTVDQANSGSSSTITNEQLNVLLSQLVDLMTQLQKVLSQMGTVPTSSTSSTGKVTSVSEGNGNKPGRGKGKRCGNGAKGGSTTTSSSSTTTIVPSSSDSGSSDSGSTGSVSPSTIPLIDLSGDSTSDVVTSPVTAVATTIPKSTSTTSTTAVKATPVADTQVVPKRRSEGGQWAGYVATGTNYTGVSGTWKVPTVVCDAASSAVIGAWVGIDGQAKTASDVPTIEQIGSDIECHNGVPVQAPWYELYPAASQYLDTAQYPVAAGDTMTASVTSTGAHFILQLSSVSSSHAAWTFKTTAEVPNSRHDSAEWAVEAPAISSSQNTPVPQFSSIAFTDCTAVMGGKTYSVAGLPGLVLDLGDNAGKIVTATSDLGKDGKSFSVGYKP